MSWSTACHTGRSGNSCLPSCGDSCTACIGTDSWRSARILLKDHARHGDSYGTRVSPEDAAALQRPTGVSGTSTQSISIGTGCPGTSRNPAIVSILATERQGMPGIRNEALGRGPLADRRHELVASERARRRSQPRVSAGRQGYAQPPHTSASTRH